MGVGVGGRESLSEIGGSEVLARVEHVCSSWERVGGRGKEDE